MNHTLQWACVCTLPLFLLGCPAQPPSEAVNDPCTQLQEPVQDLDTEGDIEDFEVELSWDEHDSDCVSQYRILRASELVTDTTSLEPFEEVDTLGTNTYSDTVDEPGIYSYTIVGLTAEGITVPPSEVIAIEFDADGQGREVDLSPASAADPRLLGTYYIEGIFFAFAQVDNKYQLQFAEGQIDLADTVYQGGLCVYGYDEAFVRITGNHIYNVDNSEGALQYQIEDNGDLTLSSTEEDFSLTLQRLSDGDLSDADTCADLFIDSAYGQYISDTTAQITLVSYFNSTVDSVDQVAIDFGDGQTQYYSWAANLTVTYPTSLLPDSAEYSILLSTIGGFSVQNLGSYTATCAGDDSLEPDNSSSNATTLLVGATATAATLTDYSDWFSVQLIGGTTYEFRTNPTNVDTVLVLYDTDGTSILDSRDDVYGRAAAITYTPSVGGVYYLEVSPFSEPSCETYTLVATTQ